LLAIEIKNILFFFTNPPPAPPFSRRGMSELRSSLDKGRSRRDLIDYCGGFI